MITLVYPRRSGGDELNPAQRMHALAVQMLRAAEAMPMPTTGGHVELRIGMHTVSLVLCLFPWLSAKECAEVRAALRSLCECK